MKHNLGIVDFVVIFASLVISAGIGIASSIFNSPKTAKDYMLANQNMKIIPVVLSIVVTLTSSITLISSPAEAYRFGANYSIVAFSIPVGMLLAAWIFIPVYFQCGVSTVNEYLEMRYGKMTRCILSVLSLVQMIIYMSAALFGAILALSAVTNLSLEISIVTLAAVCTLYCSVGGLRAVLWTDVYQAFLIAFCILSMYVAGIKDGGGIATIYNRAVEGNRLDVFDFKLDPTKRYDFWGCLVRGIMYGIAYYGTSQVEVQRILSLNSIKKARESLLYSMVPVVVTFSACNLFGIVLYSIFYNCDPILNKKQSGLTTYDQLVPSYIISKFSYIPGMTGLCIAGIFSASLSTVSSALNCASTVTVIDLIKPFYKRRTLSEFRTVLLAKVLSMVYGALCIGLCFCFLDIKSLLQLTTVTTACLEGPMAAIFLVGILTRKASDKCASFALILGYIATIWLAFGSLLSQYKPASLPLSTTMCPLLNASNHAYTNFSECNGDNSTSINLSIPILEAQTFYLYKISFVWHSFLGLLLTLIFMLLAVIVTGFENVISEDSRCRSPITQFWRKKADQMTILTEKNIEMKDNAESLLLRTQP